MTWKVGFQFLITFQQWVPLHCAPWWGCPWLSSGWSWRAWSKTPCLHWSPSWPKVLIKFWPKSLKCLILVFSFTSLIGFQTSMISPLTVLSRVRVHCQVMWHEGRKRQKDMKMIFWPPPFAATAIHYVPVLYRTVHSACFTVKVKNIFENYTTWRNYWVIQKYC